MSLDIIRSSIARTVQKHGDRLHRATSATPTLSLVTAALLPKALGAPRLTAPILAALEPTL